MPQALAGRFRIEHHRFLVAQILRHDGVLDAYIVAVAPIDGSPEATAIELSGGMD